MPNATCAIGLKWASEPVLSEPVWASEPEQASAEAGKTLFMVGNADTALIVSWRAYWLPALVNGG